MLKKLAILFLSSLLAVNALPALHANNHDVYHDKALPGSTVEEMETDQAAVAPTNTPSAESCVPKAIERGDSTSNVGSIPALGVVIELTSCIFSNVGLITEKNALLKEEARLGNTDDVKSYKLPMWWLGFVTFVAGQILSGVALCLMSVVVVTPLGSFTVICNIVTSYYLAKERTSAMQIVFSLLIVSGCVLTTVFAPWSKASDTLECFRIYMKSTDFHVVAGILASVFVVLVSASRFLVLPAQNKTPDQTLWPATAKFGRWLYPVCAGLVSVWTVNIGATLIRLFSQVTSGANFGVMESWEFYVVLVAYICTITLWQNLMNASMIVLNAAYVIPIHFALFTMLTLPVSGSLHGTLSNWKPDPLALSMYLTGLSMNIGGMLGLLLLGSKQNQPKEVMDGVKVAGVQDEDYLLK